MFVNLGENVKGMVIFGNDNEGYVMGKCTISIRVKNVKMMYVQDTLFVSNLRHNLISIGKLNSDNYRTVFEGKYCNIFYKNILVVEATMTEK